MAGDLARQSREQKLVLTSFIEAARAKGAADEFIYQLLGSTRFRVRHTSTGIDSTHYQLCAEFATDGNKDREDSLE